MFLCTLPSEIFCTIIIWGNLDMYGNVRGLLELDLLGCNCVIMYLECFNCGYGIVIDFVGLHLDLCNYIWNIGNRIVGLSPVLWI